jgi:hypothetical protein
VSLVEGILAAILCAIQNIAYSILAVLYMALNGIVKFLALLIGTLILLLPDMPALPSLPSSFNDAAGWAAWVFPVSAALAFIAFTVAAWLTWQIVAIGLRWAKALDS